LKTKEKFLDTAISAHEICPSHLPGALKAAKGKSIAQGKANCLEPVLQSKFFGQCPHSMPTWNRRHQRMERHFSLFFVALGSIGRNGSFGKTPTCPRMRATDSDGCAPNASQYLARLMFRRRCLFPSFSACQGHGTGNELSLMALDLEIAQRMKHEQGL
jgi:hypothetical protein